MKTLLAKLEEGKKLWESESKRKKINEQQFRKEDYSLLSHTTCPRGGIMKSSPSQDDCASASSLPWCVPASYTKQVL